MRCCDLDAPVAMSRGTSFFNFKLSITIGLVEALDGGLASGCGYLGDQVQIPVMAGHFLSCSRVAEEDPRTSVNYVFDNECIGRQRRAA